MGGVFILKTYQVMVPKGGGVTGFCLFRIHTMYPSRTDDIRPGRNELINNQIRQNHINIRI